MRHKSALGFQKINLQHDRSPHFRFPRERRRDSQDESATLPLKAPWYSLRTFSG